MWKVPLFELNYDEMESQAVSDVLDSRWLTMGENINRFQDSFSDYLGEGVLSTAVSSCTAALHMALLAGEIGKGDEVIIPGLTFVADANVVAITGAKPVLADCDSFDNWNVSAASIESQITKNTKAVIIVHFAGYPCEMDDIVALCQKQKLLLIEDVAHAPGARYKNQACGTFGDIACFSFFSNKNLSIGEGGMFVTKDEKLDRKAKYLRSHGMSSLTLDRYKGRAISYDVIQPGLNYRMDEMRASLGLVQLDKLPDNNKQRGQIVQYYGELLSDMSLVALPFKGAVGNQSAYHIFPVLLDESLDREAVINGLREKGVQSSIHYPSFRDFTAYNKNKFSPTPITDEICQRVLTLPLFPTMTSAQVEYVVQSLVETINGDDYVFNSHM